MGLDAVVPFAMELVALNGHVGQFFIADFDAGVVGLLVELSPDAQARLSSDAADQAHDDLPPQQRSPAPVVGDMAEHPVLDLVPLARAWREVADLYGQPQLVGQVLQLQPPQADPVAVAATTVGGDQQALGAGVQRAPHLPTEAGTHGWAAIGAIETQCRA
jgi:hypothetical protein